MALSKNKSQKSRNLELNTKGRFKQKELRMTVEEVLTNTGAAGYANRNWSNVRIYIHGVMFRMQKKYLHCEVEDYRPEYGFDYDTGEIDFDDMYVAIDLRC